MKHTNIGYTKAPLNGSGEWSDKTQPVQVHFYDGDKRFVVSAVGHKSPFPKDEWYLDENLFTVHLAYLYLDADETKKPSKKQMATWEGFDRVPKQRFRKTSWELSSDKNESISITTKTLQEAKKQARKILLVWGGEVTIGLVSHTNNIMSWNRRRVFVQLNKRNELFVDWDDKWHRSHK